MLAAMDNNHNVDRSQATIQKGDRHGEKRFSVVFPKGRKRWVAKPVKEKKDYSYVQEMMTSVLNVCTSTASPDDIGEIKVPDLPSNISRGTKPPKEEVVRNQKSRMITD